MSRLPTPAQVQAQAEARLARMMAQFDDLDAYIAQVTGRMRADGVLPDRRRKPRGELDPFSDAAGLGRDSFETPIAPEGPTRCTTR